MKILFRVDGSDKIGSGHIMRCLALAEEFYKNGCLVEFACYNHKNHLNDLINFNKFYIHTYEFNGNWKQEEDSRYLCKKYPDKYFDVLIVDHYGIDCIWESKARTFSKNIFVIDDLANRKHDCDFILDQNSFLNMESRYSKLVSHNTTKFFGSKYSLLRDEFIHKGPLVQIRKNGIRNLLITFGGSGFYSLTLEAIETISKINYTFDSIDVVVGRNFPHFRELNYFRSILNCKEFNIHIQSKDMATLMLKADLCIGAGGTTSWERCFMALPSCVTEMASNQKEIIDFLVKNQAACVFRSSVQKNGFELDLIIKNLIENPSKHEKMSLFSNEILNFRNHLGPSFIYKSVLNNLI